MKYCQCELQKPTENGHIVDTAWIPKKFAKKNTYIKIKNKGKWDNGWKITKIGTVFDEDQIFDREHITHRDVTDI